MQQKIKQLSQNPFMRNNAIFFVGSMAVAFLNYLYYPVMGRLLSNVSFGELQVVVSTFMQMTTILNVLSLIVIAIYINQKDKNVATATVAELEKAALYGSIVLFLAVVALSGPLTGALKFTSPWPFIAIAITFVITVPLSFRNAYLRAEKDFTSASIDGMIGSATKIIISVLLVIAGLFVFGAVIGIMIAQLASLTYATWRVRRLRQATKATKSKNRRPNWALIKPHIPYSLFVLSVTILTTLQVSFDVTIVKYLFSPEIAGNYAAIATVARIIFFLTGSVIAVLLSSISTLQSARDNIRILLRSTGLVFLLGGSVTAFFCAFPVFTMHLLLGVRYDAYVHLLPLLSLTLFLGSLVTLLSTYAIALRRYATLPIVALGSLTTYILIAFDHANLESIIVKILTGTTLSLVGLILFTVFTSKFELKWKHKGQPV